MSLSSTKKWCECIIEHNYVKDAFVVFMYGQLPALFDCFYERKTPDLMPRQVGNRVGRLSDTHAWQHFKDIQWALLIGIVIQLENYQ